MQERYQEMMEEYQQQVEEQNEAYQEQVEPQNEAYQDQLEAYQEQIEDLNEAYQEEMEAYQEQMEAYQEEMEAYQERQRRQARRSGADPALNERELGRIYSEAYDKVYNPAYEALYNKFGPGTEGFQEEVQRIAQEARQAAEQAVEQARAAQPQSGSRPPKAGGWGAWLNNLGREINQAMSGIGQEIGIDLNEAMNDVASAVSDIKDSLRDMVEDWQEQKEDDEDFFDFEQEFPTDGSQEEDGAPEPGSEWVDSHSGQQGQEYVNRASIPMHALAKLDIHWFTGQVAVEPWDGDCVEVTEFSKKPLEPSRRMAVYAKDGEKLTVEWAPKKFGWNLTAGKGKRLVVRVPEKLNGKLEHLNVNTVSAGIRLTSLTGEDFEASTVSGAIAAQGLHSEGMRLHAVSGTVAAEDVSAEKLKLSSVSGTVKAEGFAAEQAELSAVSGTVAAHGNAESFRVSTTSGQARLTVDQCPEKAKLSAVSGSLCLALPENGGFTAHYSSVSGGFRTDFPVTDRDGGKKKGKAVYGNGETRIEMNTTSGSMQVVRKQ